MIRSLRAWLRRWGPYRRVRRFAGHLAARLSFADVSAVYRRDLSRPFPPFAPQTPVRIDRATADEVEHLVRINPAAGDELARAFRERLAAGHACFVARVNGEIVGWNWSCFGSLIDLDGQVIRLRQDEVYTMDAFTAERWRGRGIHTALLLAMLEAARDEGRHTAYTQVSPLRRRSAKGVLRLEWDRTGLFVQFRGVLGSRPRIWRVSGSPYPVRELRRTGR